MKRHLRDHAIDYALVGAIAAYVLGAVPLAIGLLLLTAVIYGQNLSHAR